MNLHAYRGQEPFIFASYAHADEALVEPVFARILAEGYRFWFDAGIDPGTEWDENIASHIEGCGYLIAFISKNYLASENCKDELNYARDLNKKRLLVYLEDVSLPGGMAMRLNRLQAIFRHKYAEEEKFFEALFQADGISAFLGERPKVALVRVAPPLGKKDSVAAGGATTVNFPDGTVYTGTVNSDRVPHGKGSFRWPNGASYEGEVEDGFCMGQGRMQYVDGSTFEGDFQKGVPNGRGSFRWTNGASYEGEVKDGFCAGQGRMQYNDGSTFEGDFQRGGPNGKGTFRWPNGAFYVGEAKDGLCAGHGRMQYVDGSVYEGDFQRGGPNGRGSFRWPNGASYEGEVKDGFCAGQGRMQYADGSVYDGEFQKGMPNGKGVMRYVAGGVYDGDFQNGIFHGRGTFRWPNGMMQSGIWQNGQFTGMM